MKQSKARIVWRFLRSKGSVGVLLRGHEVTQFSFGSLTMEDGMVLVVTLKRLIEDIESDIETKAVNAGEAEALRGLRNALTVLDKE